MTKSKKDSATCYFNFKLNFGLLACFLKTTISAYTDTDGQRQTDVSLGNQTATKLLKNPIKDYKIKFIDILFPVQNENDDDDDPRC